MIKTFNSDTPKDDKYNQIKHTITSLYKIKNINRKVTYTKTELKNLVTGSIVGAEAIDTLKDMGVTQELLLEYELFFFYDLFKDEFPIE